VTPPRRRLAPLALFGAVIAACVFAAELIAAEVGVVEYPPSMTTGHPRRGYTLRPGFVGESRFGIPFRVSAQGFRSPEVAIPKPAGTRRVVVLGDSVTWGAGVREEETFSHRLEVALRSAVACPVDVVDTGVSGYGSVEELDVLEHEGLGFEPDVVLVYHIENDNTVISHATGPVAAFLKDRVLYHSYLFAGTLQAIRVTRWRIEVARVGGDTAAWAMQQNNWATHPGTAESLAALRRIGVLAHEHGARVILASHPSSLSVAVSDEVRNGLLRGVADETGMTFVDMNAAFVPYLGGDLAVSATDLHPNGRSHGIIADALLPVVRAALDCAPRSRPAS
jgi:hypothetical protein